MAFQSKRNPLGVDLDKPRVQLEFIGHEINGGFKVPKDGPEKESNFFASLGLKQMVSGRSGLIVVP